MCVCILPLCCIASNIQHNLTLPVRVNAVYCITNSHRRDTVWYTSTCTCTGTWSIADLKCVPKWHPEEIFHHTIYSCMTHVSIQCSPHLSTPKGGVTCIQTTSKLHENQRYLLRTIRFKHKKTSKYRTFYIIHVPQPQRERK